MRYLLFVLLFSSFVNAQKKKQEIKLEGKYRMEYEELYISENCIIKINDSIYQKKLNDGSKRKGKIEEKKLKFTKLYILKDNNSQLEVEMDAETYKPSDTIYFRTKKQGEKEKDGLTIYSGKLIKI
jgi:hypothetical protein